MTDKTINNFFLILLGLLPLSFLIGPAVILTNVMIFDLFFVIFLIYKKNYLWINQKIIWILIFFYIYLIFNIFISLNYELSIYRNLGFVRLIILFVGINYFFNNDENIDKVFKTWTVVIIILVIDIIVEKTFGKNILGFSANNSLGSKRIVSFFKDEAIPGSFIYAFSFMLASFYLMKLKNIKINYNLLLIVLILLSLFSAVIITGERSSSLKFLFSLILFLALLNKIKPIKRLIIFSFIIIAILSIIFSNDYLKGRATHTLFYLIKTYTHTFQNPTGLFGGNPYAELHRSGYEVFKKSPYFGVGNKNYRYETCTVPITKYYYCSTHPHQIYFELLSEHGFIGTAIILVIFFIIFFKSIKIIILNKNYISLGCFVYLVGTFLPIIPSGAFFSDYNLTLFFINISIMFASNHELNIFNRVRKV